MLCCLAALCQDVPGEGEHHITTASELIEFSKNVNSGTNYSGTTAFLDADIDFSGDLSWQFEPIGMNSNYYFQGTFDGQGHTISSLAMNSSSQYIGLFGHSYGATTRNVVLDSSCSIVSSFSGSSNVYVGGAIGYCYAYYGHCVIENNVNMASVSFTGSTSNYLYLGGIAGYFYASYKDVTVKNCANYGSVTQSGTVYYTYVGGIVGCSYGSSNKVSIQNCLNYGTINHSGTTANNLYIGGILGGSSSGINNLENCVSGGKITSNKASNYNGSIFGYIYSSTTIKHCYWSSDGCGNAYGYNNSAVDIDSETKQASLNTTIMDNLNSYNSSWDKWLMLHPNGGNINNINQTSLIVTQKHFPNPVKEGNTFLFWCLDTECNESMIQKQQTSPK